MDLAVKVGNRDFMEHFISCVPDRKMHLKIQIPRLLAEITKRVNLDFLMVIVVEFKMIPDFMQHLLLMVKHKIPLLSYLLETFNFSLCDDEMSEALTLALERYGNTRLTYNFLSASNQGGDERKVEAEDGTLATLARNHWTNIGNSKWPCSNDRSFSLTKRRLSLLQELEETLY